MSVAFVIEWLVCDPRQTLRTILIAVALAPFRR
jgi:hypothetical protein